MSEATDKLIPALAKLATDRDSKKAAHANHDAADTVFEASHSAAKDAANAVLAEIEQIASDSNQPATVAAPAGE